MEPFIIKVYPESSEDSDLESSSSRNHQNFGADYLRPNGSSNVAFTNIRRQTSFDRLLYRQRFPGITWERNFKYNDVMPCKDFLEDYDSDSSVVSLEFFWMEYMAVGYESDEYYEADDESDGEEAPARKNRKIERGRRSRYVEEAGTTRDSIVRYFIENCKTHSAPRRRDKKPRYLKLTLKAKVRVDQIKKCIPNRRCKVDLVIH